MSKPEQETSGPVIAPAVAAAIRDILAALEAAAGAETPRSVEPVGHGTIRLRGRPDGPVAAAAATPPGPVGPAEPVGHGRIRLHGRPLESPSAPAGALDPRADILAASAAQA